MEQNKYCIYIMTNKHRNVLYIGVTGDLKTRVYQHKNHLFKHSFTDKYNCEYCIYFEEFHDVNDAINRETELKKWNRKKKEELIRKLNPELREIFNEKGYIREKKTTTKKTITESDPLLEGGSSPRSGSE